MEPCEQDLGLLKDLGFERGGNKSWRMFCRGGHVLLVLPDQAIGIRRGIRLYQPQRFLARLMVRVVTSFPFASSLLPRWEAGCGEHGVVATICDETGFDLVSILLGNPSQIERRAVILLGGQKGEMLIVKVGTSSEARDKINNERLFLEDHALGTQGIPSVRGVWSTEEWEAFAIDYYQGRANLSCPGLCGILKEWHLESASISMVNHAEGRAMEILMNENGEAVEVLEAWNRLSLRTSIRHGDLAPWNILAGNDGKPVVIDWEFGKKDSIPGWDLVHFLYLSATLIDRLETTGAIEKVQAILNEVGACQDYLTICGWGKQTGLLIKTYFYSMKGQLDCWEKLAQSVSAN